jgi:hypothetical protein
MQVANFLKKRRKESEALNFVAFPKDEIRGLNKQGSHQADLNDSRQQYLSPIYRHR